MAERDFFGVEVVFLVWVEGLSFAIATVTEQWLVFSLILEGIELRLPEFEDAA